MCVCATDTTQLAVCILTVPLVKRQASALATTRGRVSSGAANRPREGSTQRPIFKQICPASVLVKIASASIPFPAPPPPLLGPLRAIVQRKRFAMIDACLLRMIDTIKCAHISLFSRFPYDCSVCPRERISGLVIL